MTFPRLKIILTGLALSAAVLSSAWVNASQQKAVVVGAGLAGLTAAYELEQRGYKVKILEARDRVGGRMATYDMGGQSAEMGGELLDHKKVHTEIYHYAKLFDVKIVNAGYSSDIDAGAYYYQDQLIPYDGYKAIFSRKDRREVNRYWQSFEDLALKIPDHTRPDLAPDASTLDEINGQQWVDSLNLAPFAKHIAEQHVRAEYDEPRQVSLLALAHQSKVYEGVGDNKIESHRFLNGGRSMAQGYVDHIDGPILLNHPVKKIIQKKNKVIVVAKGKRFKADVAVVTVPLPVLHNISFTPPLPKKMQRAAAKINSGSHTKVLLQYSKRFWLDQRLGGEILSDLPLGWVWESTEKQGGEGGILVTYTSGDFTDHQMTWSDRGIVDDRLNQLETMYPGSSQYFVSAQVNAWHRTPYIMGGFTAYGPGQITRYWNVFHQPAGRIYFAGEHTAVDYIGFLEGAIRSGQRVAQQIAGE